LRSDRKVPAKHSRRTARSRTTLQESRDAVHRCAALQKFQDAALARCHSGVRGVGRADECAEAARAVRKGCDRKRAELSIDTRIPPPETVMPTRVALRVLRW